LYPDTVFCLLTADKSAANPESLGAIFEFVSRVSNSKYL
jgi:hypothetical protein